MKLKSLVLVFLLLFSSMGSITNSVNAAAAVDEVIKVDDIEAVLVPDPPEIDIPDIPIEVIIGLPIDTADFCADLDDEILALIARNEELIVQLDLLLVEIRNAAAEMLSVMSKARLVLRRLNACFGQMAGTRSCAGAGYQAADWLDHNPNGDYTTMDNARDDLLDLRTDIAAEKRKASARISDLYDLLADSFTCLTPEEATVIRDKLFVISLETDAGFIALGTIKAEAIAIIGVFNAAYASFKTKVGDFLTKTQQVINDNAPNTIRNIRRTCGMSRRQAGRERRRRGRVLRCLRLLRRAVRDLP